MKTIWPKATKWTGIVLFLITSIFFTVYLVGAHLMYSFEMDRWMDFFWDGKPYESLFPFESSYQTMFLIGWGVLLLMSTLLFIGGLIAEQLASKKDE